MGKTSMGGTRKRAFTIIKSLVLFFLLIVYMLPFYLILINSFKRRAAIVKNPLSLTDPDGFGIENYVNAFLEMNYLNAFGNSLFITVISVSLIILFSSMASYLFVRADWRINKICFGAMVAAMVIPFQAIMIPLVSIYGNTLGVLNLRSTLIFFNTGFGMGLAVFIYHGFIKSNIPVSLEEAARIDGCSKHRTFFSIVLPLLKPITATVIVLDVLWLWNDYLLPSLVLGKKVLFTLPLSTYTFYGTYSQDMGRIMAGLVLTVFPVIVLYLVLQKQIISGVVSGAVKA